MVLNGFMWSILGLYDYTRLFPEDGKVYQMYRDCLQSLKDSLRYYDTGSWLKYDRLYGRLVSQPYITDQFLQMKTLFAITKDKYFDSVAAKWESYLQGEEQNVVLTNGWYHISKHKNLAPLSNIADWDSTQTIRGYGVEALFDNKQSTYFAPGPNKEDISDTNPHYIYLKLKREVVADSLVLTLGNKSLFPEVLDILYRSSQNPEWLKLDTVVTKDSDDMHITYKFDEVPILELKLVCRKAAGQNRLVFSELALTGRELESYGIYYSGTILIDSPYLEVRLKVEDINEDKLFVLYKYADEIEGLSTKMWEFQAINPLEGNRTATLGKYYQFKIIFERETTNSGFSGFEVFPRE